jgi:dTDP-glucose pyrophosphorylase
MSEKLARKTGKDWFTTPDLKCVVLCAGRGSRINSVDRPKAMIKIADKPILGHIIDFWRYFTDEFIFVVGYKKEQIIRYAKGLDVKAHFVEQKELRGIADALLCAESLVGQRFITILGDCLCSGEFVFPSGMEHGVAVWQHFDEEEIKRSYAVQISKGELVYVEEKPKQVSNSLCGLGFYFFTHSVFDYIKITSPSSLRGEIEITDVIKNMLIAGEKVSPVYFKGSYINVTYPEDIFRAEQLILPDKKCA